MKTTVHIIPHAHWDREWYLPLEVHRAKLVTQLDNVLELLENDPDYTYHLDGQMIAVEDYLMFRPEKEAAIRRFVSEGRLHIGPWYVLQDEYLTSGEANVRNLLHGMAMAERFGNVCRIGYLPDAFGNVGQMPQLFAQAGMKAAAFGRGVSLRPEDPDPAGHFPRYSEFLWQSPDGSAVPAIFFSAWYNNAMEIPTDPAEAKIWWDERLARARRFASSEHLLFMNGCDHQPVQRDLEQALETARGLYPDIDFICSDLEKFAECVRTARTSAPETVSGELCGQESDGTNTLCNTASTHVPLKILNRRNESLLSMTAEPLLSMAALAGMKTDNALLHRAWKLLLQNHPHDSICSCSVDPVNREAEMRFTKSMQLGEYITDLAGKYLAEQIKAPDRSESEPAFAVFNPSAWERTQVLSVTAGVDRVYGTRDARPAVLGKKTGSYFLTDAAGNEVRAVIEDLGVRFGYELPDDAFRKPYFERQLRVTFSAVAVPAFGYRVYYLKQGRSAAEGSGLMTGERTMENRFISVSIRPDGTFDLKDRVSGRTFCGLGRYEDTGDVGDEYIFRETLGKALTAGGKAADICCTEDTPDRTSFRITVVMDLPVSADAALEEALQSMQRRLLRNIGRSSVTVPVRITTTLTLEKDSPLLKIRSEFNNTVKDHRLRMLFPTDLATDTHYADSVFDVVERPDHPGERWTNPSRCQRMQYFAGAEDDRGGLAVINRGMYEYEILPERKTIAVTLLRSVGEMGDWGVFPTPDARCIGPVSAELALIPYAGHSFRESGCREAVQFQTDMRAFPVTNTDGTLPECGSFLSCCGKGLAVTALKPSGDEKALILRVCNVSEGASEWEIAVPDGMDVYGSCVTEEKKNRIEPDDMGHIRIPVRKKEIRTVRIEKH